MYKDRCSICVGLSVLHSVQGMVNRPLQVRIKNKSLDNLRFTKEKEENCATLMAVFRAISTKF